jgi:hypothetical protein
VSAVSQAEVLLHLAAGAEQGLAPIMSANIYTVDTTPGYRPGEHTLDVRLGNNLGNSVAGWLAWFGITAEVRSDGTLYSRDGKTPPWRSHEAGGKWQGWEVRVWSAVDEPEEPAAEVRFAGCDDCPSLPSCAAAVRCNRGGPA